MQWLAILAWTAYVGTVFVLIRRRLTARRTLSPVKSGASQSFPSLTVIVPARDEASNIAACLHSLLSQDYPHPKLEIVVVNDNSTDGTADLAAAVHSPSIDLRVINAPPLPDGWKGKPHACWLGASQAKGDWLCFIDADVRLHPALLSSALADALSHQADLLSLHPHQEMITFAERFLMPPAWMGLLILMDFDRINNPDSRLAMANGQFILVKKDRYFEFDGHRGIKSEILEDVALARAAKGNGVRIRLLAGGELIHTRMYSSAGEIWQGLTRSAVEIAGNPLFAAATILSSLLLGWLPILLPFGLAFSSTLESGPRSALVGLALATSFLWYSALGLILRWYRVPLRYLLLLPFSFTALSLSIADSLIRTFTHRRIWKGRNL